MNTWKTECVKSLVDDLVVTCDQFENIPESAVINPSNGINYWLLAVVLLAITCILLLVVKIVKYYMKPELTISYLLLSWHEDEWRNSVTEINTKYFMYYFFNDIINIKNLDSNKLGKAKRHTKMFLFTTFNMRHRTV